jgi:hypothetical protein
LGLLADLRPQPVQLSLQVPVSSCNGRIRPSAVSAQIS